MVKGRKVKRQSHRGGESETCMVTYHSGPLCQILRPLERDHILARALVVVVVDEDSPTEPRRVVSVRITFVVVVFIIIVVIIGARFRHLLPRMPQAAAAPAIRAIHTPILGCLRSIVAGVARARAAVTMQRQRALADGCRIARAATSGRIRCWWRGQPRLG